jgi:uncharacterized protein
MYKALLKKMTRLASFVILAGAVTLPAAAMSAKEARKAGLIVEDCKGYVKPKTDAGKTVADEINAKRQAEYQRIAAQDGVDVNDVAATAGTKQCKKHPAK